MPTSSFFDVGREQSLVKSSIVSKYFKAWATVIKSTQMKHGRVGRLAYVDLFAGPGQYKDGTESTPLMIMRFAVADPYLCQNLVTYFNDIDRENALSLKDSIAKLPGVQNLAHQPIVTDEEVGEEIVGIFESIKMVPTLLFVDPWGYKGLSLRLLDSVLKDWGSDCIFFFNYNRINAGIDNPIIKQHMDSLFGESRADYLRIRLGSMRPEERELAIVEELSQALRGEENRYVLPFTFRNDKGTRTSHHLVFVSKHQLGYQIMKDIMAKESTSSEQGVPSFTFNQADKQYAILFELARPLDELSDLLLEDFQGQTLTVNDIFEQHNVGRRYIKKNYKDALIELEAKGLVSVNPQARRKGTMADWVTITFP